MTQSTDDIGDQPWGFWVIIRNKASAAWAVRMSGLVTFLLGLGTLMSCVIVILTSLGLRQNHGVTLEVWKHFNSAIIVLLVASIVLIFAGLRTRAGNTNWLLVTAPFVMLNLVLLFVHGPVAAAIVYTLQVILLMSGIRGWWWLKRHDPDYQGSW